MLKSGYMTDTQSCIEVWNYATNALIAFIGFGVVVLMGLNFIYALRINSMIKKGVEKGIDAIRSENKRLEEKLKTNTNGHTRAMSGNLLAQLEQMDKAFVQYLESACDFLDVGNIELMNKSLTQCIDILDSDEDALTNSEYIRERLPDIKNLVFKFGEDVEMGVELCRFYMSISDSQKGLS